MTRSESLLLLIFVLALLFPVISITDDLQMDLALVETSLSSRESTKLIKPVVVAIPAKFALPWLLFVALAAMALVVIWRSYKKVQSPFLSLSFAPLLERRPPPPARLFAF